MITVLKYLSTLLPCCPAGRRSTLVPWYRWLRTKAVVIFIVCPFASNAQQPILLQPAVDSALKSNLSITNERLRTEYAKALIKSAANIPASQVAGEFGSFNSALFDTRFSASQSFALPAVYNKQKQLFTREWESALLGVSIKEYELKKAVAETFYNYLYLQQKEKLLAGIDSLYGRMLERANQRLQKGESNILEKTTFETQKASVELQMSQINQQRLMTEELFQLLLNTHQKFVPSSGDLKISGSEIFNLSSIEQHPSLKLMSQQQQVAKAITDVERSKLLPEIMIGYNNSSIQGVGAGNVKYSAGDRFHSGLVGLGIPLFTGAQKARIKAGKINEQVIAGNYDVEKQKLQNLYLRHWTRYQQNARMLELYHNQHSKNIDTIKETANKQFLSGEINYLELVMLLNQAIAIQSNYIDLLNEYNKSVIDLKYLNK